MKKNYLFTATILFTVTTFTACKTTSNLQCDEMYEIDYNCSKPQVNTYIPGGFYRPTYNTYRDYYPNTQTIYYVPIYNSYNPITIGSHIESDEQRISPSTSRKRPVITRNSKN